MKGALKTAVAAAALLAIVGAAPARATDGGDDGSAAGANAAPAAGANAASAAGAAAGDDLQEIVVTGIRKSLTDATNAKRDAVNFTDSIFAEDIGKFPDQNLAEALNRVPGVQITRDIDGEGTQIAVRGLGPSFTKILLNGAQIAVASDGTLDAGNSNREVDMDMFPTELFSHITVDKTPQASLLEGGIAGTVDIRQVRPFDNAEPGLHVNYGGQEAYSNSAQRYSPRGSLIISDTWNNTWGLLVGVAGAHNLYRTDGYETIGVSSPKISCAGCDTNPGNAGTGGQATAGSGFTFPSTVPAGVSGMTAGAPLDVAQTSGQSLQALSNGLLPRLARDSFSEGHRDRISAVISGEYRPSDDLHFSLDMMYGYADRAFNRYDMNWQVRNSNYMVPENVTIDPNGVVTSGTYANSQFFLEARPYHETVDFFNVNPSMEWKVNDWIKVQGQVNYNKSDFIRQDDSFLFQSPLNSGLTVTYSNPAGAPFPSITPSASLANPNLGWTWMRANVQPVYRETYDRGTHWDATFGDDKVNLRVGIAYDDTARYITAEDNSTAFQTAAEAAVPNSALSQYLKSGPASNFLGLSGANPGYSSFIIPDIQALMNATGVAAYQSNAPLSNVAAIGGENSGTIIEQNLGGYVELNAKTEFLGHTVAFNGGLRDVRTDQFIEGPSTVNGITSFLKRDHVYDAYLPSFNVAANLTDDMILRLAGSRTMTRPDPNNLLPGTSFSDPSAQVATQGNPNLQPYFADNFDLGLEYYTGGAGYVSADVFTKAVTGFTVNQSVPEPFSALGIPLSSLTALQQQALAIQNGVNTIVSVNQQVNVGSTVNINGVELGYVQPLDFLVKGLGFNGNYTHVDIAAPGNVASQITGIAPNTYNLGAYYENYGFSLHVTYVYVDKRIVASSPQNNVYLPLIQDATGNVDLSASYTLPWLNGLQVTFDATNLTNERLRTVDGYENLPYTVYYPGSTFVLGFRGKY